MDAAWAAAQVITSHVTPELYEELQEARREAREYMVEEVISKPTRLSVLSISKKKEFSWKDVEITPEISRCREGLGSRVPLQLAKKLKRLLNVQVMVIEKWERMVLGKHRYKRR